MKDAGDGPTTKIDLAREMIRKFPEGGNRTIAKELRKFYPAAFPSVEKARDSVRLARGAIGARNRLNANPATYSEMALSQLGKELACLDAGIPDDQDPPLIPYDIGTGDDWLIIADLHIPQHSKMAIETAIDFGVREGVQNVLILGDAVEHSQTSRFGHDPKDVDVYGELRALTPFLKFVREKFSGRIAYKEGNHEENLRRYIWQQAAPLASLPCLQFRELACLANYGIEHIPQDATIRMGKLSLIHGHEYRGGSAVYPARWLLLKAMTCCACAHHHRSDTARGKTVLDAIISTWSIGCLRSMSPSWCLKNGWNWGLARCSSHADGNFEFRNLQILGPGEVVPA